MATEDELIGFVLDNFRAVGTGQTAAAEDIAKVRLYIPSVLAELSQANVIYIADGDTVPDAALQWVAAIISHAPGLRNYFGEPQDLPTVAYCEARLQRLKPVGEYPVTAANYF